MGLGYKVGDVVWAYFRFEESNETKARPVVILEILEYQSYICMITSKDLRGTCKGVWVLKDSPDGQQIGLLKDSICQYLQKNNRKKLYARARWLAWVLSLRRRFSG